MDCERYESYTMCILSHQGCNQMQLLEDLFHIYEYLVNDAGLTYAIKCSHWDTVSVWAAGLTVISHPINKV